MIASISPLIFPLNQFCLILKDTHDPQKWTGGEPVLDAVSWRQWSDLTPSNLPTLS